jgi:hypothetical protein
VISFARMFGGLDLADELAHAEKCSLADATQF